MLSYTQKRFSGCVIHTLSGNIHQSGFFFYPLCFHFRDLCLYYCIYSPQKKTSFVSHQFDYIIIGSAKKNKRNPFFVCLHKVRWILERNEFICVNIISSNEQSNETNWSIILFFTSGSENSRSDSRGRVSSSIRKELEFFGRDVEFGVHSQLYQGLNLRNTEQCDINKWNDALFQADKIWKNGLRIKSCYLWLFLGVALL